MNQPMSRKFENYRHITALHMIIFYYWEILICHFLIKTWKTCVICLNWIISLKTQRVSKAHTPHVLIIFTLTKMQCSPKFIYYKSYNNYIKEQFENVLKQRLVSWSNFEEFFYTFLATLNEHAPLKMKKIRYNQQVFMSKNTFNKKRSSEKWQNYKRQCNISSIILKSTEKTFFETLNINEINDNRKFWKTVKPFSTDKCKTTNNIILTEKIETLNEGKKISNIFNEYFTNITKGLNLHESSCKLQKYKRELW